MKQPASTSQTVERGICLEWATVAAAVHTDGYGSGSIPAAGPIGGKMRKTVETIGKDTADVGWRKDYRWHKWTPPAQPQGAWRAKK